MSQSLFWRRLFWYTHNLNQDLIRYSAERACAVRPSPRANTDAVDANDDADCSVHMMTEDRFWKSYTPKREENLAVRAVGKT